VRKTVVTAGIVTALILLVVIMSGTAVGQETIPEAPLVGDNGVSLTVYNQGTALVQDHRTFDFQAGLNSVLFTGVAASIDRTSVSFSSLTDPSNTTVLEQNYRYDLVGAGSLMARYVDSVIEVVATDGTQYTGQLLNGQGGEIILRLPNDEVVTVDRETVDYVRFPELPEGLITRPTLHWLVQSGMTGPQEIELTYLTGGMTWRADYSILLDEDAAALDLGGWVTLTNTSGARYEDAQLKLLAGDVNRIHTETKSAVAGNALVPTTTPAALGQQVAQREVFEYQLYEVARPVTIGNNETKQVEFVNEADIPATIFFVFDASPVYYGPRYAITDQTYGQNVVANVQTYLEFSTGEEEGLGADLPAGRVRVYQNDVDGAALFIRQDNIEHTPEGEEVTIYLSDAFDLIGRRVQTNFEIVDSGVMYDFLNINVLRESDEIHLFNYKDDQTVEIRVPEHLFRWSNWQILSASYPYEQLDASTIEFRVEVPPRDEVVISYMVQYGWPD
jgi:hypothetical protein